MNRRVMPVAVAAAVGLGALLGCGKDEIEYEGTIGLSVLTLTNPFFGIIADTMTAEAAKYGYKVEVVSGELKVTTQKDQIQDFINRGVNAIVLNPCDSESIGPAIQEANKAGIPVFTCDIKCQAPDAKVVCHVATANYEGGKLAGKAMIEALGEAGGKVLIIDYPAAESCIERVRGFKEVIEGHNRSDATGKIRIVAELDGRGEQNPGNRAAADTLTAHPDLAGIFAINDPSGLGAVQAIAKAGKSDQVKIVAFDGQRIGKEAIKRGEIYADPIQFPDRMAVKTVEVIMKHFNGEKVPEEILIPTELYRQADALEDPELK